MALSTYTTADEIRSVLGVSEEELADDVIYLPLYDKALTLDLAEVDTTLETTYASAKADPDTATKQRLILLTDLFATYSVAKQLTESLPNFSPRTITDGKAMLQRQLNAEDPVIKAVREGYGKYRVRLLETLNTLNAVAVASQTPVFLASARGVDPVTGA